VALVTVSTGALVAACGSRVEDRFAPRPTTTITPVTSLPSTTFVPPSSGSVPPGTSTVPTVAPTTGAPTTAAPTTAAPTTTAFDEEAARADVRDLWETFFDTTIGLDERVGMLEHGEDLREAVSLAMQNPLLAQAVVTVTDVSFESPERAIVVYDVALSGTGQVVLPGALGIAVRVDGVWRVSEATMCGLADLAVEEPVPGCD